MNKENLSTKPIWEFTKEDTIYIPKKTSGNSHTFLCQFQALVGNRVHGKIIAVEKGVDWAGKVGEEIYADYRKCSLYGAAENTTRTYHHYFNPMGVAYKEIDLEETEKVIKHPSFGLARFAYSSGGNTPLFGSTIQHQQLITLTLKRAENHRHLNRDWFHSREELIEVQMSGAQFAELITTFNQGEGVPVTIRSVGRQSYPDPPYESPVDNFNREFKASMENLDKECQSTIEDAVKMLTEKASLGKGDREFLIKSFERLISTISSSTPFVAKQFSETMDKTVSAAKTEIETFVTNKIMSLGLDVAKTDPTKFLDIKLDNETKEID